MRCWRTVTRRFLHPSCDHGWTGVGKVHSSEQVSDPPPGLPLLWSGSLELVTRAAWAKLIARVGEELPLEFPNCGGEIRLIAFITEPRPIRKILTSLGEPLEQPPLTPATHEPPISRAILGEVPLTGPSLPQLIPEARRLSGRLSGVVRRTSSLSVPSKPRGIASPPSKVPSESESDRSDRDRESFPARHVSP